MDSSQKAPASFGLLLTLGWTLASWMALGTGLGHWIDLRWRTAPWGIAVGSLIGMVGCAFTFIRVVQRFSKFDSANTKSDSGDSNPPDIPKNEGKSA